MNFPDRVFMVVVFLFAGISSGQEEADIPKYPEPEIVLEAMNRAAKFYRTNLSFAGGYARSWSRDSEKSFGEGREASGLISIQPSGTTTVGLTMLNAYLASDDPLFRQGAKEAAQALMWCQLSSGGWQSEFRFDLRSSRRLHFRRDVLVGDSEEGKRSRGSSLDDNKSQSAIRFLMHLANSPAGHDVPELREALDFAWDGLLAAQAPNGGWPQIFRGPSPDDLPVKKASFPQSWPREFPGADFTKFYTLNDNNLERVAHLLIEAHKMEPKNNERFVKALRRLGDFLQLAQMPEPQPAWAQQYDFDMHPAWARKFEPPAISSGESLGAIRTLIEIWLATGDEKYIESIPAALTWFERSRLPGEKNERTWARFYELETNRPLYCEAETYLVTYDDTNLPTHYGYKISYSDDKLGKIAALIQRDREEILAERADKAKLPIDKKGWASRARKLASRARSALKSQKTDGYWIRDDRIDAGEFDKQMKALTEYYESAVKGGETFAAMRGQP